MSEFFQKDKSILLEGECLLTKFYENIFVSLNSLSEVVF